VSAGDEAAAAARRIAQRLAHRIIDAGEADSRLVQQYPRSLREMVQRAQGADRIGSGMDFADAKGLASKSGRVGAGPVRRTELIVRRDSADGPTQAWDALAARMPDWPAGRIDDAGLTLADTVSYAARSTDSDVRVLLETTGERGDRQLRATVLDRGTGAPPEDVLADPAFGRLDYRLRPDDPSGWTREMSFHVRETPPLPGWLGDAVQPVRHVRLQAGDDLAIGVRARHLPQLEKALAPHTAGASPSAVAKDNLDIGLRHAARINHGRLHAGRTDLEPAYVQLRSGGESTELSVYPFWDQDFRDGLRQLDLTADGSRVVPVTDFADAIIERLRQSRATDSPAVL
jgi:hypothetical protein